MIEYVRQIKIGEIEFIKYVYIAEDGTEFDDKDKCIKYENREN